MQNIVQESVPKLSEELKIESPVKQDSQYLPKDLVPVNILFSQRNKLAFTEELADKVRQMKEEENEPEIKGCVFGVEGRKGQISEPQSIKDKY